ncbi:uncharacterized protein LOC115620390 [Scaptodrosophila lebanonensis]|uniref:Uncharacterized protein LOC115620390 n=1 Tax=Drosophila lebanonensis TaxID=7225 RepID=A0A6J2T3J2_DROLE|nr:uncharacterized protein LOC115620390 [Scaptodrosophila lebanonensis]
MTSWSFLQGNNAGISLLLLIAAISPTCGQLHAWQGPKKCPDVCPSYYNVVCAIYHGSLRTFASSCVMHIYNCKYQTAYRIIARRACEFITDDQLQQMELWPNSCGFKQNG